MSDSDYRVCDHMASEILAEAARLHSQALQGYSLAELQQACSQAGIPPHIVNQAIENLEQKHQTIQHQLPKGNTQIGKTALSAGVMFLIAAITVSGIVILQPYFKSLLQQSVAVPTPIKLSSQDFRSSVIGKTKQQVIQAIGRPNSTSSSEMLESWQYQNAFIDPASGKMSSAKIDFDNGIVYNVDFYAF